MKKFNRMFLAGAMMFALGTAQAEVVAVVSAKSAVTSLSKEQVSDIFLGKAATFPGGGQAVPVDQVADSAAREEFYSKVTGRTAAQLKSYWAKLSFSGKGTPPKAIQGDDELKKLVAANPNIIGYIEKSKADASVKVVFTP